MKLHRNQKLPFSWISMTPGTWNFTKIRRFNFLEFSWPPVHETSQKSKASFFLNFHDLRYMKLRKNQTLQFSLNFMTSGTWNFTIIRHFNFLEFSWPPVHETSKSSILSNFHDPVHETSQKSKASIFLNFHDPRYMKLHKNQSIFLKFHDPRYMKLHKNQTLQFSQIFMTPSTWNFKSFNFIEFLWPGTWNFTKIKSFRFLEFSWPPVHETSQKSDT